MSDTRSPSSNPLGPSTAGTFQAYGSKDSPPQGKELERFTELTGKLLTVPKPAVDDQRRKA